VVQPLSINGLRNQGQAATSRNVGRLVKEIDGQPKAMPDKDARLEAGVFKTQPAAVSVL
jgi:hypothetical protein